MNFFEHQDRARRNTQQLVGLFVLSVLFIIITIYSAAVVIFRASIKNQAAGLSLWNPQLFLTIAIPTVLIIGCGSWFKIQALKQGGGAIAKELGGRQLIAETASTDERQLLNVVEEMAIASGTAVPPVYVLDSELGINAFAAGYTPNDAVIGVTRGCLEQLSRDELQGVIGHEFSHILNGDMRLNLRLVGLLHGILFIYIAGRLILETRSRNDKENSLWQFGIALIVIGGIGVFCGRLIKSAVSRQREFLADASAVQFTRNPSGLGGALDKIAQYAYGSSLNSPHAEEHSHLFFGSALRFNFLEDLFATHPPLEQRIGRLKAESVRYPAQKNVPRAASSQNLQTGDTLVAGLAGGGMVQTGADARVKVSPKQVVNQVGTVAPEHFAYAQTLLAQLPEPLQRAIQERQSSMAIVYGLLLDSQSPQVRSQQVEWLRQAEPSDIVEQTLNLSTYIDGLEPRTRLPLLDLTVPALRQCSTTQFQQLFKCIHSLAKMDGQWSLSEFALQTILWHRLQPYMNPTADKTAQYTLVEQIWSDWIVVLSGLARVGQNTPQAIAYAFRCGIERIPGGGQQSLPEAPPACNLSDFKKSLDRLSLASAPLKQAIVDACAHTVLLDNSVSIQEAELLRAIAIALDCPLPPFLNSQRTR